MQPRESKGWDEGLAGIRAWKEAVRTGVPPKEFSLNDYKAMKEFGSSGSARLARKGTSLFGKKAKVQGSPGYAVTSKGMTDEDKSHFRSILSRLSYNTRTAMLKSRESGLMSKIEEHHTPYWRKAVFGENIKKNFSSLLSEFSEKPFSGYTASRHAKTGGLNDKFRKNKEFATLNDTEKAVWRHYYKGAKKTLRSGNLHQADGYFPSHARPSKTNLVWRGTNRSEVEQLDATGKFKSNWSPAILGRNGPDKLTWVASHPRHSAIYAAVSLKKGEEGFHLGPRTDGRFLDPNTGYKIHDESRIYGITPKVMKRASNEVRSSVGNYDTTAPIRGGIRVGEVRSLLKPSLKKNQAVWKPTPLGDIQKKNFSSLTHPTLGMALKNFQLPHDYATQPDSSERREFIKTGILGAGIAAGAGIGAGSDWVVRR